ncbi:MAG: outer membrane beta-barrel protein [Sphaerospermopsis sp. SIO1G2]|nr:outer membrane beta-barrel protein [Sphaerospermopsis sp. SIO1G2]
MYKGSALWLWTALTLANPLSAQERYVPTQTRETQAYTPQPYRSGAISVLPSISTQMVYSDNIFAIDERKESDILWIAEPSLIAGYHHDTYEVSLTLDAEIAAFNEFSRENYADYGAALSGALRLSDTLSLPVRAAYARRHFRRISEEDQGGLGPTEFDRLSAGSGVIYRGPYVQGQLLVDARQYHFDDALTPQGVLIDNSAQDRDEFSLYGRVGLAGRAVMRPYLYGQYDTTDFNDAAGTTLIRDSDVVAYGIGSEIALTNVLSGDIYAGLATRSMDARQLNDVDITSYGASLTWEPVDRLRVELGVDRGFDNTVQLNTGTSIRTEWTLEVDYEFYKQWLLEASALHNKSRLLGSDTSEEVERYGLGMGASYKVSDALWVGVEYRHLTQDVEAGLISTIAEFSQNIVSARTSFYF